MSSSTTQQERYDRYQIKFIVQKQIKPLGHNVIGFLYKLLKNSILEFE